jgi:hypothetical protein
LLQEGRSLDGTKELMWNSAECFGKSPSEGGLYLFKEHLALLLPISGSAYATLRRGRRDYLSSRAAQTTATNEPMDIHTKLAPKPNESTT